MIRDQTDDQVTFDAPIPSEGGVGVQCRHHQPDEARWGIRPQADVAIAERTIRNILGGVISASRSRIERPRSSRRTSDHHRRTLWRPVPRHRHSDSPARHAVDEIRREDGAVIDGEVSRRGLGVAMSMSISTIRFRDFARAR